MPEASNSRLFSRRCTVHKRHRENHFVSKPVVDAYLDIETLILRHACSADMRSLFLNGIMIPRIQYPGVVHA